MAGRLYAERHVQKQWQVFSMCSYLLKLPSKELEKLNIINIH